jgi:hypothetical protein
MAYFLLGSKTDADIIVMCGVHFMGETAKILCPDKKVLIPDFNAGCSLADSCPADKFSQFVKEHPDHTVISYVNTSAAVKAVTDVVVTSTNAKQIVESFAKEQKIIFGPDKNLGNYINSITNRNMLLWDGACHVHEVYSTHHNYICICFSSPLCQRKTVSNKVSNFLYFVSLVVVPQNYGILFFTQLVYLSLQIKRLIYGFSNITLFQPFFFIRSQR